MPGWLTRRLSSESFPVVAALLAVLLTLPALGTGLIVDDYVHRAALLQKPGFETHPLDIFAFVPDNPDRLAQLRAIGLPWWSAPDLKLTFWRPLAALTHAIDYALWPDAIWAMHLQSVLWYGALVFIVARLFRRLLGTGWIAGLAAFAYGVAHAHAMPVFFLANRNALVGSCFAAGALLLHDRGRADGDVRSRRLAPLLLLLGLLGNEGAVAIGGYLVAYAWWIDRGPVRERLLRLLPYLAVVLVWQAAYHWLGYGARASAAYIDPVDSPLRFAGAVAARAPILLLGQWLIPPSDWAMLAAPPALAIWRAAAGVVVLLGAAIAWPLLRREQLARFWFAGMLLSLLPSCATFTMDRMLLYSGVGAAALIAQFVAAAVAGELAPPQARLRRLIVRIALDAIVVVHLILSPVWLPLRIVTTAETFDTMTEGVRGLADEPAIGGKLVVLIDDALDSGMYFSALRALSGREPAGQFLVLAPAAGRHAAITLQRPADATLLMRVEGGYRWFLERDETRPFRPGDRVTAGRVVAEIREVGSVGEPTLVAFHFDTSLDDPSIVWFGRIESATPDAMSLRGRYPQIAPPAIGRTIAAR